MTFNWGFKCHKESAAGAYARPSLLQEEMSYPSHMYDLMVMCWSHDPSERPSANQITEIASSTEFCQLQAVYPLEDSETVLCAAVTQHIEDWDLEDEQDMLTSQVDSCAQSREVWVSSESESRVCHLKVFTVQGADCVNSQKIEVGGDCCISVMCVTGDHIWCADSSAIIHIYSIQSHKELLTFKASSKANVKVKYMTFSSAEKRVYVILDNNGFSVCDVYKEEQSFLSGLISSANQRQSTCLGSSPPHQNQQQVSASDVTNRSLVLMECCGNGKPIHCMAAIGRSKYGCELWCGQNHGKMSIWRLDSPETLTADGSQVRDRSPSLSSTDSTQSANSPSSARRARPSGAGANATTSGAGSVRTVSHFQQTPGHSKPQQHHRNKDSDVMFIVTDSNSSHSMRNCDTGREEEANSTALWTYTFPGTVIYRWDVSSRQISHQTDISLFYPEQIPSALNIHITRGKIKAPLSQVLSMAHSDAHLFVTTTLGSILVLSADTLVPISVVYSHVEDVRVLLPLTIVPPTSNLANISSPVADMMDSTSVGSSVGSVKEDTSSSSTASTCRLPTILSIGRGYNDMMDRLVPKYSVLRNNRDQYMMLWRTEEWNQCAKVTFHGGGSA